MRRLSIALALMGALALAWVGGLGGAVGDALSAARERAAYQAHRGEIVLAYPVVLGAERLRAAGAAVDELRRSAEPSPAPRAKGKRTRRSAAGASARRAIDTVGERGSAAAWLDLPPERRWQRYSSPEMRPVRLVTRAAWGGFGGLLGLALLRTLGRRLLRILLAPAMILWTYRRIRPGESHGTARWANERSLRGLAPRKGEASLVFGTVGRGRFRRQLVAVREERTYEHVYVAAPTGSGKTTSVIVPNLLEEPGTRSLVVTDPKGELMPLTYDRLHATYGERNVRAVDFADPWLSRGYNPLAFVTDATSATLFADTLVQNTGVSQKDPFWANTNRQIIAAAALDLVRTEEEPPLVALANLLAGSPPEEIERRLLASPAPEARRVAASQLAAIRKNDKLLGAVFTEIAGRFEFLLDERIRAVTSRNEVDLARLGSEPGVLYLPLYLDRNELYKPLTACLFANLFTTLTDAAKATRTKTLPTKVMCYMDEFGVMGRIPNFENRLATVRGYGIGCLMVVQSRSQLDAQYGEDAAKSILQNANAKLCLSGVTDEDARMFSELGGMATVMSESQGGSRRTMALWRDAGSRSRSEAQRALMPTNDLRTMGEDVFAVLRGEHPIRARRRPYYEDRRLRRLVPDLEATDVLARLRRQWPLSDPGLGAEIPVGEAIGDAIATQQAEGAYVKGGTSPGRAAAAPDHSARNSTTRFGTRVRIVERRPVAAAAVDGGFAPPRAPDSEAGGTPLPPLATTPQPDGATLLTDRHVRVLALMAEGKPTAAIAGELGYKVQTVKNYTQAIYGRLGVQTRGDQGRRDAVAIARERGLVSPEPARGDDRE